MIYVESCGYVCQDALEEGNFFQEFFTGWWYDGEEREYLTSSDGYCFFNESDARRAGYEQCSACGEWRLETNMQESPDGEWLCRFCREED